MLIEKLTITDHPSIGLVELDFLDETESPARTVVIAGQNGVGKTVVLEAIQSLFEQTCYFPGQIDADLLLDEVEAARVTDLLAQLVEGERMPLRRRLHVVRRSQMSFSIWHPRIGRGSSALPRSLQSGPVSRQHGNAEASCRPASHGRDDGGEL